MTRQLQLGARRSDSARFSDCGLYRYELTRELGGDRVLASIGLNPSTADAEHNDPTLRKDIGFARRWRMGRLIKGNAYAYKATDPRDMERAAKAGIDIVGPDNNRTLVAIARLAKETGGFVVVSWGANIDPMRQHDVAALLSGVELWCFGTNLDGSPVHELYQPYSRELVRWRCP